MLPMIELGALLVFGVAMVALIVAFGAIVKALFWVILFPVRLVVWGLGAVLMLPLLLLKLVFGGIMMVLALPLVLLGLVAAALALVCGVLVPALPIIVLGALFWYLVRPEPTRLVRS